MYPGRNKTTTVAYCKGRRREKKCFWIREIQIRGSIISWTTGIWIRVLKGQCLEMNNFFEGLKNQIRMVLNFFYILICLEKYKYWFVF